MKLNKTDKFIIYACAIILIFLSSAFFQGCAETSKKEGSQSFGSCFDPEDYDLMTCQNVCPNLWVYIRNDQVNYFETEQDCATQFNLGEF